MIVDVGHPGWLELSRVPFLSRLETTNNSLAYKRSHKREGRGENDNGGYPENTLSSIRPKIILREGRKPSGKNEKSNESIQVLVQRDSSYISLPENRVGVAMRNSKTRFFVQSTEIYFAGISYPYVMADRQRLTPRCVLLPISVHVEYSDLSHSKEKTLFGISISAVYSRRAQRRIVLN
jgi:hypothetical protein